jgi:transposase
VGDSEAVARPAADIRAATGDAVYVAYVDQGYTGHTAANAAAAEGITVEVVNLSEFKPGFVLLPRRWVVERSFAWATRCRRLVKNYKYYAETLAGLHFVAFVGYMLKQAAALMQSA